MGAELTAFDYRTRTKGNKAGLVMWPATRQLKIHAVSWRNCSGKTTTLAQQNIGFGLNSTFQHHASPSVCLIASKKTREFKFDTYATNHSNSILLNSIWTLGYNRENDWNIFH